MLPTESAVEDLAELRDAIIELYLAIKIRSTEEVSIECHNVNLLILRPQLDKITDRVLEEEKQKLEKVSGL